MKRDELDRCPDCKGVMQHREGCPQLPPWPPAAAGPEPVKLGIRDFPASEYLFPRAEAGPEPMPERAAWTLHVNAIMPHLAYDGTKMRHIADVLSAVHAAGLAIVPAADVPSPEERKVLEACAAMRIRRVRNTDDSWSAQCADGGHAVAEAELARRAAKGGKP